jgi:hypothetical protein
MADWINGVGVLLILAAFALLQVGRLNSDSKVYLMLNFVGSCLAAIGSWLIRAYPFVVLEGVWAVVSLYSLDKRKKSL